MKVFFKTFTCLYRAIDRISWLIKSDQKLNNYGTDTDFYFSRLLQVTDSLRTGSDSSTDKRSAIHYDQSGFCILPRQRLKIK